MSFKLKALGLGLLAAMAFSAVAVMNASATVQGHFVSDVATTHVIGSESGLHRHDLLLHGFSGEIGCEVATYTGTTHATTVTSINIAPKYEKCYTTPGPWHQTDNNIPITLNGCTYTFTVTGGNQETTEHKVDLVCPNPLKGIEIHHPNCTATVLPQTVSTGVTYTRKTNPTNGKHEITLDTNVQFNIERHGLCGIFGTSGKGTLKGSATVVGLDGTNGPQIGITST